MTQDRRITDKLPGHPLQWDDSASPSAAPAAGQAGLAKLAKYHVSQFARVAPPAGDYYLTADVQDLFATFAASGAAGAEQATDSLRALCAEMVKLHAERSTVLTIHMEELGRLLAAPVAAPASFFIALEQFKQSDQGAAAAQRFADAVLAAAPVAADTEQARDAVRYRWLRNQQSWGTVVYEAIGYGAGEDFDKAIDAAMGFTPGEISPALHSDDALRKTEGYRLGYMEGVARKQVDILEIANERRAVELTAERMADNLSEEEKAALDRLDKPEWRAASNLKLRALLAVEVANCIRMGAKIENLQDELRATEGYRRGYADGAADAAGIADVQNDWRGIWDEAPVQGEGVIATDGATVIAARWFATGWAKHDHFSEEVEYLPEGWVTHWKPMPAAGRTAPLATPADAGAGHSSVRSAIIKALDGVTIEDGTTRVFNLVVDDIEREVLARLSTSGAPVTAPSIDTSEFRELMVNIGYWAEEEEGERDECAIALKAYVQKRWDAYAKGVTAATDYLRTELEKARAAVGQSPAPVTAEPVAHLYEWIGDPKADECAASQSGHRWRNWGPNEEHQCEWCGEARSERAADAAETRDAKGVE